MAGLHPEVAQLVECVVADINDKAARHALADTLRDRGQEWAADMFGSDDLIFTVRLHKAIRGTITRDYNTETVSNYTWDEAVEFLRQPKQGWMTSGGVERCTIHNAGAMYLRMCEGLYTDIFGSRHFVNCHLRSRVVRPSEFVLPHLVAWTLFRMAGNVQGVS